MNVFASAGRLPRRGFGLAMGRSWTLIQSRAARRANYVPHHELPGCAAARRPPSVVVVTGGPLVQRVEVSFVGVPPVRRIERAAGVSDVIVEGRVLRCVVTGSFQPLLEALRGHEVVSLRSTTEGH